VAELEPGSVVAGYRIEELLGRGAMGAVFRAVRARDGQEVALKVLAADLSGDPELRQRFEREGRAALAISHPHVVACHEVARGEGRLFLALELVPGGSLEDLLKHRGALAPLEAARLGAQIARGLAAIHGAGIVHRDLKPGNVLLDEEGSPKVSDFGLAGATTASKMGFTRGLTATGELVGTPSYMAPEQVDDARQATERSDLYALGCVLFALVTGEPPFTGGKLTVLQHHLEKAAPAPGERVKGVPAALDRLVVALLAKKPEDRPASATAVALELEAIAGGGGAGRGPALVAAALVLVALVAAGVVFLARGPKAIVPEPVPAAPLPPPPAVVRPLDVELPRPEEVRAEAERLEREGKVGEAFSAWSRVVESTESSSPLAAEARLRLRRLAPKAPRAAGDPGVFKVAVLVFDHTRVKDLPPVDLTEDQLSAVDAAVGDWRARVDRLTRGALRLECHVNRIQDPVPTLSDWNPTHSPPRRMPVPDDLPLRIVTLGDDYDYVVACVPLGTIPRACMAGGDWRGEEWGVRFTGVALANPMPSGIDFLHCWLDVVRHVLTQVQGWPDLAFRGDGITDRRLEIGGESNLSDEEACERIMTEHVTERMWRQLSARVIHPNPWNHGDVHEWRVLAPRAFEDHTEGYGLGLLHGLERVPDDALVIPSAMRALNLGRRWWGDYQTTAAETWVKFPQGGKVTFLLGHDDGAELFVNEESLWHDSAKHHVEDEERIEGTVNAGWNRVAVHVENQNLGWGLSLRVRDRDGHPIPGIELSVRH